MELHPFQQTLVDEIISNKIYDLRSFFETHCLEVNPQNQIGQIAHLSLKCTATECIDRTVKFVSLWKRLEKEELIYTASDRSQTSMFDFFTSQNLSQDRPPSADFIFSEITRNYIQKVFFPNEELKAFKERKYKTSREAYNESEEKYRKKSFWLAFGTAIVAVITSLGTTFFIHNNSSKERVVTIKNAEVLSDTVRVLLLSHDVVDTTLIRQMSEQDSVKSTTTKPR